MDHPSLNLHPASTLNKLEADMKTVQHKLQTKETAKPSTDALDKLDSIKILAAMQQDLANFTQKYGGVLDKIGANADSEAELIALTKDKISKL